MNLQLDNKTALVTGSTAGIGLEIARSLAAEGAHVLLTGRSRAKLDAAAASVRASEGAQVTPIVADAGTADGAAALTAAAADVDILVNNLGIYESRPFGEISDSAWRELFEINVMSGVRLSRAYLPGMLERNWGRIIFVSSESALMAPADMLHYATTKTAQLTIARGLAQLTKGTKVTVNAVMPGPTQSEGIVDFLKSVVTDPDAAPEAIEAEFFAKHRATSIIQRMIDPAEVANLVAFLASPLSSATNGAALRVEGGLVPTIA